jgi:hypothetical protein
MNAAITVNMRTIRLNIDSSLSYRSCERDSSPALPGDSARAAGVVAVGPFTGNAIAFGVGRTSGDQIDSLPSAAQGAVELDDGGQLPLAEACQIQLALKQVSL